MSQTPPTLQALRAEDVMTRNPVTLDITSTVQDAADMMFAAEVRHIPVVTHGTLVGMISDRNLRSYMLPRPERIFRADEERARMAVSVSGENRCGARAGTRHRGPDWYGQLYRCTTGGPPLL
jgi:predicted transcriptional regulator